MSAAEALKAARTVGIELVLDGNSLVLEAASEPPAVVLEFPITAQSRDHSDVAPPCCVH